MAPTFNRPQGFIADPPDSLDVLGGHPDHGEGDAVLQDQPLGPVPGRGVGDVGEQLVLQGAVAVQVPEQGPPHEGQAEPLLGRDQVGRGGEGDLKRALRRTHKNPRREVGRSRVTLRGRHTFL